MFDFYYNLTKNENAQECSNVRRIVECGLQATVMIMLALVGATVPIFGILAFMCYPAPILLVSVRFGLKEAFLCGVAATLLITFLLNPFTALRIFFLGVPIGLFLGYGFKEKWPYFKMITLGSLLSTGLIILVFAAVAYLLGDVLVSDFVFFPDYESIPFLSGVSPTPENMQVMVRQFFYLCWPTILFVAGLMMVIPSIFWSSRLLKRFNIIEVRSLSDFPDFRLPSVFTGIFGLSVVALAVGLYFHFPHLIQFGFNLNLICALFGFAAGAALYCHFTKIYHWHIAFRVIGFILIVSISLLGECLVWIGLIDPVLDFRKRFQRKKEIVS